MIEFALQEIISTDPAFMALAGNRVYPDELPQAPEFPCCRYVFITGLADYHLQGGSGLRAPRVQFDFYAESADDVIKLKEIVFHILSGFKGEAGSPPVRIQGAFMDVERSGFAGGLRPTGPRVFQKSMDFIIWYQGD